MNKQYSKEFSQSVLFSKEEAKRLGNPKIGTGHLLLGILRDYHNKAVQSIEQLGGDLDVIREETENLISNPDRMNVSLRDEDISIDTSATNILRLSVTEAMGLQEDSITTTHLLLAILKDKNNIACRVLNAKGIEYDALYKLLTMQKQQISSSFDFEEEDEKDQFEEQPAKSGVFSRTKQDSDDTPFLDKFGMDITQAAEEGRMDPVVGRESEIERIAQILSRRKKNNPILIGEPGVGKTAIVEGLAQRIAHKNVPIVLLNKRVIALDMSSIVAGTKYRGQFEERIQGLLDELKKNPNIILFIDEIHTIVGAGSAAGSMDAANMLKPALSRGTIQCIGATTTDEYRKTIEKDGALERRFQKIMVSPTTPEETLQILKNIKDKYEDHHNVTYTEEALEACVKLTERYISDRKLPDKAIDAMDEAGSRIHIVKVAVPKEIKEKDQTIEELKIKKMAAVKDQNFELAANLRDDEAQMEEELQRMKTKWEQSLKQNRETVDRSQVEETVSIMSGVPVQRMMQSETVRLKGMKDELEKNVIAQDKAIEKLVKAITRNRIGLRDPGKPIGTFMFLGPTGVGKTYLAKKLADFMFGSPDALIRIDMSEYMEKYSTSRLVGAPPGYVGYDEGGQLTEKVRRRPYSIILLDEIEKANKDVFNILLQVMDEGRLTDSNGTTVDFKNTVIIITSNCGTREVSEFGRGIGFQNAEDTAARNEADHEIIRKALNKQFAPEFINRLDDIIMFDALGKESIGSIAELEYKHLNERMKNIGYSFKIDKKAKDFIIDKGYDEKYGARPLKRAIQTYIEDGISDFIMNGNEAEGNVIHITKKANEEGLSFS